MTELEAGRTGAAWDGFLERYRRLLFAAVRHYMQDHDDVMDAFTFVCERLRDDELRRLRAFGARSDRRARFSTWLTVVARNLCVDWIREQKGRTRPAAVTARLSPLQSRIYEHVFRKGSSHAEAYESIRSRDEPDLAFGRFLRELRSVYGIVTEGRGRLPRELSAPPPPDVGPDASLPMEREETRCVLARALERLSAVDRTALQMYVVDELPAADVAEVLGLPNAKAVYNRVYRAVGALREELERAGLRREDL